MSSFTPEQCFEQLGKLLQEATQLLHYSTNKLLYDTNKRAIMDLQVKEFLEKHHAPYSS